MNRLIVVMRECSVPGISTMNRPELLVVMGEYIEVQGSSPVGVSQLATRLTTHSEL